jgi:hypothetical protein
MTRLVRHFDARPTVLVLALLAAYGPTRAQTVEAKPPESVENKAPAGAETKVALDTQQKLDLAGFLALLETDACGLGERARLVGECRFPAELDFSRPYFRNEQWVAEAGR